MSASRKPRPKRAGTIHRYAPPALGEALGHYVVRCSAPDGSRPIFHLDASPESPKARKAALSHAERITERLWVEGLGAAPKRASGSRGAAAAEGESVAEWVERWIANRRERGLSSVDADESRFEYHVAPEIGPLPMASVTTSDLERLVERLDAKVRDGQIAWKTAQHIWGLVSKMFGDARKSKTLALRVRTDNPAADVAGPDRGVRKAKAYLYPDEFARLMASKAPLRLRRAAALAVYLFPRAGELEALEWQDVDLDRGIVHVHRAIDRSKDNGDATKSTKTGVPRRFNIEPNALPLLRALHDEREGKARVLDLGRDLARELRKHLERAGVKRKELLESTPTTSPITWHDLRATGLTWMAIRGDDPLKIMQRAGHTDFRTTQLYVREAEAIRIGFGEVFPPLPGCLLSQELSQKLSQHTRSRIKTAEAHGNRTHPRRDELASHRF